VTFSDIQTEIADRLGITASADLTRIGRAINRKHREVLSSLGIRNTVKRTTATSAMAIGFSTLSFSSCEKVITIVNRNVTPYFELEQVTLDEIRNEMPFQSSNLPTRWAPQSATADSVVVLLNCIATTTENLHGDIYSTTATISGATAPAFPESYHDILIDLVLIDEYLKLEKPALSKIAREAVYGPVGRPEDGRMAQLRLWYAVSTTKETYAGKTRSTRLFRNNTI
jgi:hypothetical protein